MAVLPAGCWHLIRRSEICCCWVKLCSRQLHRIFSLVFHGLSLVVHIECFYLESSQIERSDRKMRPLKSAALRLGASVVLSHRLLLFRLLQRLQCLLSIDVSHSSVGHSEWAWLPHVGVVLLFPAADHVFLAKLRCTVQVSPGKQRQLCDRGLKPLVFEWQQIRSHAAAGLQQNISQCQH